MHVLCPQYSVVSYKCPQNSVTIHFLCVDCEVSNALANLRMYLGTDADRLIYGRDRKDNLGFLGKDGLPHK